MSQILVDKQRLFVFHCFSMRKIFTLRHIHKDHIFPKMDVLYVYDILYNFALL